MYRVEVMVGAPKDISALDAFNGVEPTMLIPLDLTEELQ
jgi:hypothetical protein